MIFKTFFFLLLIPVLLPLLVLNEAKAPRLFFSSIKLLGPMTLTWRVRLRRLPFYLRLAAVVLFLIALSGPRQGLEDALHKSEGIDIVLAIDASGSMTAEDFTIGSQRANRLAIVKKVTKDFVEHRPDDRIGIVVFSGRAYTISPLTTDKTWIEQNIDRIDLNDMPNWTAIGSAIMSSLSRLKNSEANSKVIILMTDGVNNYGNVTPQAAAKIAQAKGVKIYTIGVGTKGMAPYPRQDPFGNTFYQQVSVDIDEDALKEIATATGGEYFRATDTTSLENIYRQIDMMEKTKFQEYEQKNYRELFGYVLGFALFILLSEMLLSRTVLMQIP